MRNPHSVRFFAESGPGGSPLWRFRCDCGAELGVFAEFTDGDGPVAAHCGHWWDQTLADLRSRWRHETYVDLAVPGRIERALGAVEDVADELEDLLGDDEEDPGGPDPGIVEEVEGWRWSLLVAAEETREAVAELVSGLLRVAVENGAVAAGADPRCEMAVDHAADHWTVGIWYDDPAVAGVIDRVVDTVEAATGLQVVDGPEHRDCAPEPLGVPDPWADSPPDPDGPGTDG